MGILDKLKGKAKSGLEGAQKSAQERKVYRDEINLIRKEEKIKQEKKHARFTVQEEYRQKRKKVRTGGGGGFSLDELILGNTGGGRGGGDPMGDLILGRPQKPKTKRKERKRSKPQPHVTVIIQEPKKRKRRKRKK